ncbi:MAG: C-GCAxxG-C-C family protein [Lachnospiraceae bacterium]|nr:C-GCAxxG-C-C family protein [Lachnospiraceae bacterium]
MTIEERAEKAVEYKHTGCNCCQAVTAACADLMDADPETVKKLTSGFAVGMGCMEATCGSLIGAVMTAGMLKDGRGTPMTAKQILQDFEQRSGATLCKDLKGRDTGKVVCECDDCVRNAVRALYAVCLPDQQ